MGSDARANRRSGERGPLDAALFCHGVTRLSGAKRTLSHETSSQAPSLMRQKGRMARLRRLINGRFLRLKSDRFLQQMALLFFCALLIPSASTDLPLDNSQNSSHNQNLKTSDR